MNKSISFAEQSSTKNPIVQVAITLVKKVGYLWEYFQ